MRRGLFAAALVAFAAAAGWAQGLSVAYLEGEVQVRIGTAWSDLSIGDSVPTEATVRVLGTSSVELKGAGADFFLNRPGTYAVRDLLVARRQLSSRGVTDVLANSLRYLTQGPTTNQGTTAGARGANKSKSENDSWIENGAEVFLDAGKEFIRAGKFDKAIEQFNEALDSASDSEIPEIQYYLAEAASLNGDVRGAWKEVAGLKPCASDNWTSDFVLLKAKLLEDTSAYSEAVEWLSTNDLSQDAQRSQLYLFLLGLGYRGAGDETKAQQALSRVVSISADSDIGKAATELLK
jgi:tetratricopeptide (TPR) repeat protein